jgi:hypothetical protein
MRATDPASTFGGRVEGDGVSRVDGNGDGDPNGGTGVGDGTDCGRVSLAPAGNSDGTVRRTATRPIRLSGYHRRIVRKDTGGPRCRRRSQVR